MVRQEEKKRELKRAAGGCFSLDSFVTKLPKQDDDGTAAVDSEGVTLEPSSSSSTEGQQVLPVGPTPALPTPDVFVDDIGRLIVATKTPCEILDTIAGLCPAEKYHLLKNHVVVSQHYIYPTTFSGGHNRSFQPSWCTEYSWLVYSPHLDGAFCLPCALFEVSSLRKTLNTLVNCPFRKWSQKSETLNTHATLKYHKRNVLAARDFCDSMDMPEKTMPARFDCELRDRIQTNRKVVKSIAEAVLLCARQCIGLRGTCESSATEETVQGNPGNFMAVLQVIANHEPVLQQHLQQPVMKTCKYTSPQIQNELLHIIGRDIIQKSIIDELKSAEYFSVLADEVTSHNVEELSLCFRFVDASHNIREEFIDFIQLERITGEHIAEAIVSAVESFGLPMSCIVGQGYDGAANMSSNRVGVQARIRQSAPLATYFHCGGHCLNLVIVHSCSLPNVRNVIDKMKAVCIFFRFSPKRENLLNCIIQQKVIDTVRRKALLDLCRTRWAERHEAYSHFYQSFIYIVAALEVIVYGHSDVTELEQSASSSWDSSSKSDAQSLLHSITSFDFIITFLTTYHMLSHLSAITTKLQRSSLDILEAYAMVEDVKQVYQSIRSDVDTSFSVIYNHALRVAEAVGTDPVMPRLGGRQQHRSNVPAVSVREYYQRNLAIPLLDTVITELDSRFADMSRKSVGLLGLIPAVLCENTSVDPQQAADVYRSFLPEPDLLETELIRYKLHYMKQDPDSRPGTCAAAIKDIDSRNFSNISVLLKIACTLPVSSCECERSASVLRRLHTWTRATMAQDRLGSLALIHTHYRVNVNLDDVVDIFAKKHSRRMQLSCLLTEQ